MSEFTKGEWFRNGVHIGTVTKGNGVLHVAKAMSSEDACFISKDEADANARLISAAPDLLKICEEMIEELESQNNDFRNGFGGHEDLVEEAKRAIAKAKGEK